MTYHSYVLTLEKHQMWQKVQNKIINFNAERSIAGSGYRLPITERTRKRKTILRNYGVSRYVRVKCGCARGNGRNARRRAENGRGVRRRNERRTGARAMLVGRERAERTRWRFARVCRAGPGRRGATRPCVSRRKTDHGGATAAAALAQPSAGGSHQRRISGDGRRPAGRPASTAVAAISLAWLATHAPRTSPRRYADTPTPRCHGGIAYVTLSQNRLGR